MTHDEKSNDGRSVAVVLDNEASVEIEVLADGTARWYIVASEPAPDYGSALVQAGSWLGRYARIFKPPNET